jgi:hypothetical protein
MEAPAMEMNESARNASPEDSAPEHDQDSDPPRTAVPPDSPTTPGQPPASSDPAHDQDSDPPRTPVI